MNNKCYICEADAIYDDKLCRICKDFKLLNNYAAGIIYLTDAEIKEESLRIRNENSNRINPDIT